MMKRNLKMLGLALAAAFTMSAVAGATAQAHMFTSSGESTILTGTTVAGAQPIFETPGAEVKCARTTYSGHSQRGYGQIDHRASDL
jgi:hypothetical protein